MSMIQSETNGTMHTIHQRSSVRNYASHRLDHGTVRTLLEAATRAPTAIHREPWEFVIVQDASTLKSLSNHCKTFFLEEARHKHLDRGGHLIEHFAQPAFNIFYNAGTLIIICADAETPFATADCWLAAENLMLAAFSMGLGSCVIGSAVSGLNTTGIKTELGIPRESTAIVPIIVGVPDGETPPTPRKQPRILSWKSP